jgi:hypothetical protein
MAVERLLDEGRRFQQGKAFRKRCQRDSSSQHCIVWVPHKLDSMSQLDTKCRSCRIQRLPDC